MKENNKDSQDFIKEVKNTISNTKEIYANRQKYFFKTATRFVFLFMFLLGLLFPTFGLTNNVNVFDLPLGWVWFLIYLITPFVLILFGFNKQEKTANLLFKILTILAIVIVAFQLLSYILVVIDPNYIAPNIKFGYFLEVIMVVGLSFLLWKESIVLKLVYSMFKVKDEKEIIKEETTQEPVKEEKVIEEETLDETKEEVKPEKTENEVVASENKEEEIIETKTE